MLPIRYESMNRGLKIEEDLPLHQHSRSNVHTKDERLLHVWAVFFLIKNADSLSYEAIKEGRLCASLLFRLFYERKNNSQELQFSLVECAYGSYVQETNSVCYTVSHF